MELNEASRKRPRTSTSSSLAGDPDRLSELPDCLLHKIMSLMKARQVVQTCVLSKRWRHLWRSVPCLDIDLNEFNTAACTAPHGPDTSSVSDEEKVWEDFGDFAVNLMLRRSIAVLDSFRLHVSRDRAPPCGNKQAGDWIRRAMKYCAPDTFIQREGLSSGSWRLKRLHLCNVALDERFAKHVSSVCHSLENLKLYNCSCPNIHSITSHSLKTLVLKDCTWGKLSEITSPTLKTLAIDGAWNGCSCLLVISAPAVACLFLAVNVKHFDGDISINEMPYLDKVLIHLRGDRNDILKSKLGGNLFKLLCGVSNVKILKLKGFGTMVLGEESMPFLEFKNLRNLLLDSCDLYHDFQTLGLFLQNSPNLEKLTLQHCKFLNDSKRKKGVPKPKKPSCDQFQGLDFQCENLKLTEIIFAHDDVRPLVKLLLRLSRKLPKNCIKLTKID